MANDNEFIDEGWTVEERSAFASLPRERIPSSDLKVRATNALRQRGLLAPAAIASSRRAWGLVAAASLIFFITGAAVGYAVARRSSPATDNDRIATTRSDVASVKSDSQPTRHVIWY